MRIAVIICLIILCFGCANTQNNNNFRQRESRIALANELSAFSCFLDSKRIMIAMPRYFSGNMTKQQAHYILVQPTVNNYNLHPKVFEGVLKVAQDKYNKLVNDKYQTTEQFAADYFTSCVQTLNGSSKYVTDRVETCFNLLQPIDYARSAKSNNVPKEKVIKVMEQRSRSSSERQVLIDFTDKVYLTDDNNKLMRYQWDLFSTCLN